jgi:DNA recombination protein RmuC
MMESAAWAFAGLMIGFSLAWFMATTRAQSERARRLEEVERRAGRAEANAAAAEATTAELRRQIEEARTTTDAELHGLRTTLSEEHSARVKAETEKQELSQRLEDEKRLLREAQEKLTDTFRALATTALEGSQTTFLALARETFDKILAEAKGELGKKEEAIRGLVSPLADSLKSFDDHVRRLETTRQQAYTSLESHLTLLAGAQERLQRETANLVTALRTPRVRGRWGELTLRRVVELAGMSEHCDFTEQLSVTTDQGRVRPDLVVHLPVGRAIVVDAKVPLDAYLDAVSSDSEQRRTDSLARHADQMRAHMLALSAKTYWDQFERTPEFVIMFIPGESFFAAAADADHRLIEDGMKKRVVLATPTTLIALLHAVAYGWKQERLAENAQAVSDLGKQLYERMRTLAGYITDIGNGLDKATHAYNSAVGSLESRILPAARRFRELGAASGDEIPTMNPLDTHARHVTAPDLAKEDRP